MEDTGRRTIMRGAKFEIVLRKVNDMVSAIRSEIATRSNPYDDNRMVRMSDVPSESINSNL